MYHANRMLLEHAVRRAEESAARAELAARISRARPEPPAAARGSFPPLLFDRLLVRVGRGNGRERRSESA